MAFPFTLVDLLEEEFSSADVLDMLKDYAENGLAIGTGLPPLLLKFKLSTATDVRRAYEYFETGLLIQLKNRNLTSAFEYFQAMNEAAERYVSVGGHDEDFPKDPLNTIRQHLFSAHKLNSQPDLRTAIDVFTSYIKEQFPSLVNDVALPKRAGSKFGLFSEPVGPASSSAYMMGMYADGLKIKAVHA